MSAKQDLARQRNWCLFILSSIRSHTWALQNFGVNVTQLRLLINQAEIDMERLYQERKNKLDSVKLDRSGN